VALVADPSVASTKARVGRYAKRVDVLLAKHERAMLGELTKDEMAECMVEYAALLVERVKLGAALDYITHRLPGETAKEYRQRRSGVQVLA
jgi:hypothetical protein